MPTLLIVDDHDSFRSWARRVLTDDGFEVVGEAADGAAAIDAVAQLHPEVTLLDIVLPDMTGFEVASSVHRETIVVLTSSRSSDDVDPDLVAAVSAGFVEKADLSGTALLGVVARDVG
ncbi:response regulator [Microbacterium ulmi]|nr:response regulator [Microbacterium ulmi]NII71294.1 DNA-binding NarL/FixJ family response regulator [Microbacterium ulmi]